MVMRDSGATHFWVFLIAVVLGRLSINAQRVSPGQDGKQGRIVGGTRAGPLLTRHIAHLIIDYKDGDYSGLCTATVVAPRWLLTAAHCFVGANGFLSASALSSYAFVGEPSARLRIKNMVKRPYWMKSYFVHRNFKTGGPDHRNDIALVYLDRPIGKGKISTVKLARNQNEMPPTGMSISAAGYGRLADQGALATYLMKTSLLVKPFEQCFVRKHEYYRRFLRDSLQVCAVSLGWPNSGRTDTCYGDSGGPLFYQEKSSRKILQFGLISFGTSGCATRGSVAWYTRVSAFYGDIHQKIYKNNSAAWKAFF